MWRATGGPRNIQARIPGTAGAHTGLSNLYIWGTVLFGVPRCVDSLSAGQGGAIKHEQLAIQIWPWTWRNDEGGPASNPQGDTGQAQEDKPRTRGESATMWGRLASSQRRHGLGFRSIQRSYRSRSGCTYPA